jgi:GNAT superfamily N-acetyltransferase
VNDVRLRPAVAADIPTILDLIRELADYERDPDAAVATAELMHDALFGADAVAHVLMAEDEAETLGFALYFFNFSTWTGRPGLYLEDFYVRPSARSRGIGRQLFARLASIAQERGCGRMELSVLNWNVNAIRFYERQGGIALDDWTHYRFGTNEIARIAAMEPASDTRDAQDSTS